MQNLHYTYDPVGNITRIRDDAQQIIFFRNRRVEPSVEYTYDAIYRLIEATGREHLGQIGRAPMPHSHNDAPRVGLLHPNDGNAMGTYMERYLYDSVGNILEMQHRGSDAAQTGWTRHYVYAETSLIEDGAGGTLLKTGDRLSSTTVGNENPSFEQYLYDVNGNMIRMPHLGSADLDPNMHWDHRERLRRIDIGGGGTTYYVYGAAGQRVRKVWEKSANFIEERIYLGGFEIFRRHNGAVGTGTVTLERETLHIMDDKQCIALVETRTVNNAGNDPAPPQLIRYQFENHLGSASLELDDEAQIISYEEFTPYGSTSYQATRSQTETPKRYRYTGKERDLESGLYYHGARYFAPWIGRWVSADPSRRPNIINAYMYVNCNPVRLHDPNGMDGKPGFWEFQAEYWKGVGSGAAEFAGGVANAVAHPVDTAQAMGRAATEAYRQDGVIGAINQFNPVYHAMVGGYEYYQAASRGDPREAGRQAFRTVSNVASTALLATGAAGLASGGGAAGGASVSVRVPAVATAVTPAGQTALVFGTRALAIPGRVAAAGPPAAAAGAGVLMMAANGQGGPPQGSGESGSSTPPRSQPGSGAGQRSTRGGAGQATQAAASRPSLIQQATQAGVREVIEQGEIEVFAHGTTASVAEELVSTQGGSLSASGGNFGGQFHTVPNAGVAAQFAARSASRVAGQDPVVVGVALPKAISDRLKSQGLLTRDPIPNPPPGVSASTQQWVFQRGAIETLKSEGFFFRAQ
jgi:RHS repeat-associated protein